MATSDSEVAPSYMGYQEGDNHSSTSSSTNDSRSEPDNHALGTPLRLPYSDCIHGGRRPSRTSPIIPQPKALVVKLGKYSAWVNDLSEASTSLGRVPLKSMKNSLSPFVLDSGGSPTIRSMILDNAKPHDLRVSETVRMPSLYYFDTSIPFRLPEVEERLDSWSGDTIAMSFEAFHCVCPFPLPVILLELCSFYDISLT